MADKKKETPKPPTTGTGDAALDAFLAQLNQPGATTANYVGLPQGKPITEIQNLEPPAGQNARYYEGAEWMPVLLNWDPRKIERLQSQLVQSGLLNTDYSGGAWDSDSRNAFTEILSFANASGQPWEEAINTYMNSKPMEIDPKTGKAKRRVGGPGRERAPLTLKYTNPDDVATLANEVSLKKLGRKLKSEEMNTFVQNYQALERGEQTKQYSAAQSGGSYVSAPSVETAATQYAEKVDPVASQARTMLPLIDGVNQMLNGPGFETTRPGG
jgi:hypothetical protein